MYLAFDDPPPRSLLWTAGLMFDAASIVVENELGRDILWFAWEPLELKILSAMSFLLVLVSGCLTSSPNNAFLVKFKLEFVWALKLQWWGLDFELDMFLGVAMEQNVELGLGAGSLDVRPLGLFASAFCLEPQAPSDPWKVKEGRPALFSNSALHSSSVDVFVIWLLFISVPLEDICAWRTEQWRTNLW